MSQATSSKWTKERQRQYVKQYYQLNKDKRKAYYLSKREHFLEYKKQYYKKNREYFCLIQRINYWMKKSKNLQCSNMAWPSGRGMKV